MNYIQATIRVGILLLAGAVDVPALGQLPFAPAPLRTDLLDAIGGVGGSDAASHLNRARVAVFIALSSPEYLVQR